MAEIEQQSSSGSIAVRPAQPRDLASLTTIHARAFHNVNAYVRAALPDTPAMRVWWRNVYTAEMNDTANCHPLVAVINNHGSNIAGGDGGGGDTHVVGVTSLRRIGANGPHGGLWTAHAWSADHNEALWRPAINSMTTYERRLMGGKEYFLLEIMAVTEECKGTGIGRRIVARACEIADASDLPIFLQSGAAKEFYLRLDMGFRVEAEPAFDDEGRTAAILVRPARGQR